MTKINDNEINDLAHHYNDSLIKVWKITANGVSMYLSTEKAAIAYLKDNEEITIKKMKIHREVFERLPEFEGF